MLLQTPLFWLGFLKPNQVFDNPHNSSPLKFPFQQLTTVLPFSTTNRHYVNENTASGHYYWSTNPIVSNPYTESFLKNSTETSVFVNKNKKDRPPIGIGTIPPLIPRKHLFGYPDHAEVQISPDGKYLTYLAPFQG